MTQQMSYSRVGCYKTCPRQYKLRYIDGLKTYFNNEPANPLIIGTALHHGIEMDAKTAIDEYYANYPIINDKHVEEAIKLEYLINQCHEILPEGCHEIEVLTDEYRGYLDLLVPVGKDEDGLEYFDLYDFKYSNNVANYMESEQLHVYKYYFEKTHPKGHIRRLYFVFAPKVAIRLKYKNKTNARDETIMEFRARLRRELSTKAVEVVEVPYDPKKVKAFLANAKDCKSASTFPKTPVKFGEKPACEWCEFKGICQDGDDLDIDWEETPYKDYQDYIKQLKGEK